MSSSENYAGNLDFWQQAAAIHGLSAGSRYYDLESVIAGGTLMTVHEQRAIARATQAPFESPLSRLTGVDVLHLQSHIGVDGVVMARDGARVTCADFSPVALERCHQLAAQVGVTVSTVEVDARELPASLDDSFDLVYATIGAHCWIDDLGAWMRSVARVLRPGGHLVVVEVHPILNMVDSRDPLLILDFPYGGGGSITSTFSGTYDDPRAVDLVSTTTVYAHSIGDEVSAALAAGLVLEHLEEHTEIAFDPSGAGIVVAEEDGQFRLRIGQGRTPDERGEALPVVFTLIAAKPH